MPPSDGGVNPPLRVKLIHYGKEEITRTGVVGNEYWAAG
jgi:hypothetical protein